MKRISLIFPSRDRLSFIHELMESLHRTTRNPQDIEILIAIDNDDEEMALIFKSLEEMYNLFSMKFYSVPRSEHFVEDYVNFLARKAEGRWIIPINDDSVFMTKEWDTQSAEAMEGKATEFGDDLVLGLFKDGINRTGEDKLYPHFSCWSMISKEFLYAFGYIFNPEFNIWGVDHFVAEVYRHIGRLVSLTHIFIDHNSAHLERRPHDAHFKRIAEIETRKGFAYPPEMVEDEARMMLKYIGDKQNTERR